MTTNTSTVLKDYVIHVGRNEQEAFERAAHENNQLPAVYAWRRVQRALGIQETPVPPGWATYERESATLRLRFSSSSVDSLMSPEISAEMWMSRVVRGGYAKRSSWEPCEDEVLRRIGMSADFDAVVRALPGHTPYAIRVRASKLGLRRPATQMRMNTAATKNGISVHNLSRALAAIGVKTTRSLGNRGGAKPHKFVMQDDVDRAIAWHKQRLENTEMLTDAARRLGVRTAELRVELEKHGWTPPTRLARKIRISREMLARVEEARRSARQGESIKNAAASRGVKAYSLEVELFRMGWKPPPRKHRLVPAEMADEAAERILARKRTEAPLCDASTCDSGSAVACDAQANTD